MAKCTLNLSGLLAVTYANEAPPVGLLAWVTSRSHNLDNNVTSRFQTPGLSILDNNMPRLNFFLLVAALLCVSGCQARCLWDKFKGPIDCVKVGSGMPSVLLCVKIVRVL